VHSEQFFSAEITAQNCWDHSNTELGYEPDQTLMEQQMNESLKILGTKTYETYLA
jgi:hypothetical protein